MFIMKIIKTFGFFTLIAALTVFSCSTDTPADNDDDDDDSSLIVIEEKPTILDDAEYLLESQPPAQTLADLFTAALPAQLSNTWKIYGHKNPLWTGNFGADPNILIYNDRLYVYTSNDTLEYTAEGQLATSTYQYGIQGIRIVSSSDLVNWTDHGPVNIVGPANTNPLIEDKYWQQLLSIPGVERSWAPTAAWKVINRKPMFFLYWGNGGDGVGVVTSNTPVGPWTAPLNKLLVDRDTPTCAPVRYLFDPSVFIDDDGQGYLFFGGGGSGRDVGPEGNARRVKLGGDMISLAADPVKWDVPWLFEASDMKKLKGVYYFSYSANSQYTSGGSIVYVRPIDPMSGFGANPNTYDPPVVLTTAGVQLGSSDTNTHHAMFEFRGETYMIYHTQKVAEAMGVGRMRSPSIDRMPINANGTIDPV